MIIYNHFIMDEFQKMKFYRVCEKLKFEVKIQSDKFDMNVEITFHINTV